MKKHLLKFKWLLLCITILIIPVMVVYANNTTGGSGNNQYNDCGYPYCFLGNDGDGYGLRFSLYEYKGESLTYHKSVDFCVGDGCFSGKTAKTTSQMSGSVAYQTGTSNFSFGTSKTLTTNSKKFSCYNGTGCSYQNGVDNEINSFFKLGSDNYEEILNAINGTFGTSLDDLTYTYITIEPTIFFYNKSGSNRYYYYGTAYELIRNGSLFNGMQKVIRQDVPRAIMATSATANDENCFVGTSNCSSSLVSLVGANDINSSDKTVIRNTIKDGILNNNKGYGINVLWIGSPKNTPQKERTCLQTCNGMGGDDLLGCAESYCQEHSDSSDTKKSCITGCGVNDPGFGSCDNDSSKLGKDTVCDQETNANNSTCEAANTNTYYKTVCTDSSTIKYGNSLPTTVSAGYGFSYTPMVSGNKTCQMTFDVDKWKFDYATSYTDEQRKVLEEKINTFNNVSDTSIWVQDVRDVYKYNSSDASISIEITTDNDLSKENRTTTKKLIADKTINLLEKNIVISSAGTVNVPLFAAGNKNNTVIFSLIQTNSSNKTSYKLPGVCMRDANGTLYDLGPNGNCDTKNDGPYYNYYTDLKIKKGTYDTFTTVNKESSSLKVNNTCNYSVNIPVSCSIAVTKCDNDTPAIAELRIENKNNLNISYGISDSDYALNGIKSINLDAGDKKLYGSVGLDGKIITTCSMNLNVDSCNNKKDYPTEEIPKDFDPDKFDPSDWEDIDGDGIPDGNPDVDPDGGVPFVPSEYNCKKYFRPSEYSGIQKYCSHFWMNDKAGYSSEKDCYNSCSSGNNTCKNNPEVDRNNILSVTEFCSIKQNREANGYNKANYGNPILNEQHNIAICINDCMILPKDNECLGIACDYLYRPISLKDPFPNNRNAGYNWYGKEIFITDDLMNPNLSSGAEAEYVIELTPDAIDSINKQTDSYNDGKNKNAYIDYVYENDNKKEGKYKSKFIHSNDVTTGGFGLYFTKILN